MEIPPPPYATNPAAGLALRPPRYVVLPGNTTSTIPSTSSSYPLLSTLSSKHRHRRRICCCCCFRYLLLLVIVLLLALFVYVYFFVNPKLPTYTVDSISAAVFDVNPASMTVLSDLILTVRADNPNAQLGIRYNDGGTVEVKYRGATLCSGPVPSFYQPEKNVTEVAMRLSGRNPVEPGARAALLQEQHDNKGQEMPLDVRLRIPVGVRVGAGVLEIGKVVTVDVDCVLVVDGLSPGRKVAIKSAQYNVHAQFL